MTTNNLISGKPFPQIIVPQINGGSLDLGTPSEGLEWKMIVVYRGKHCPICTNYLNTLNSMINDFKAIGVDIAAVSADPLEKAESHLKEVNPDFAVGYDLSIEQMQSLGLFISKPRNEQETDRPFSEPGLFVVNSDGLIQVLDVSTAPFARPELSSLLMGLTYIRNPENNYPIRGTYQ